MKILCPSQRTQGVLMVVFFLGLSATCQAITVTTVSQLQEAVSQANGEGDKNILLADGIYALDGVYLRITADGVTVRGTSGDREAVVLDGDYVTTEVFQIVASHVTISDLTIKEAYCHPIHIMPTDTHDVEGVVISNVHIIDPGQQAIKINQNEAGTHSVNTGIISDCLIELTDSGRPWIWTINESCYTGGVDAHHAANWTVRDNTIKGFWCSFGLSEHGIHFWKDCTGTLVERNSIIDCDRGIGFGLGGQGHVGGIIRNNMIYHGPGHGYADVGIGLETAPGAQVYNNTIYHEHTYPNAIEYRFTATTGVSIVNNLTNRTIARRDSASATLSHNRTNAEETWFVDPDAGDLHLASQVPEVVDRAQAMGGLTDDIDQDPRPLAEGYDIGADEYDAPGPDVQAPVLKWEYGGCYSSWCETGWYSSPAVADLDGDGHMEVIASAYSIVALDGNTGVLKWRTASGHDRSEPGATNVGRTWPGIVVADVDGDTHPEIVTAHGGGYVSVYDHNGYFQPGWPRQPVDNELRGLVVHDLEKDGTMEIIVTAAVGSKVNTWVFEHNGSLRGGWPQLGDDSGYAWGVFNDNAWAGDLDNDGISEIVVPSDVHYICAYRPNGVQVQAHAMYGNRKWGKVGVWESLEIELREWGGDCSTTRAERYRANFAHGASVISDVNADGIKELVVVGNMYDCYVGHPPGEYNALFILNADRSRFNQDGYDWQTIPVDTGAPLSEDYDEIENNQPNPVVVDLDGDGNKEILFSSYDGRVHCFWLDKTEHHNWPFAIYDASEGFYRFGSEPVVADLDNDGKAEVIVASWVEKNLSAPVRLGKLHILDFQGNLLHELDLPAPKSSSLYWNGALAAPTLANIDQDPDLELVVNTYYSGFLAYDLPGTANARVLWSTGRNKADRSGSQPPAPGKPQPPSVYFLLW